MRFYIAFLCGKSGIGNIAGNPRLKEATISVTFCSRAVACGSNSTVNPRPPEKSGCGGDRNRYSGQYPESAIGSMPFFLKIYSKPSRAFRCPSSRTVYSFSAYPRKNINRFPGYQEIPSTFRSAGQSLQHNLRAMNK